MKIFILCLSLIISQMPALTYAETSQSVSKSSEGVVNLEQTKPDGKVENPNSQTFDGAGMSMALMIGSIAASIYMGISCPNQPSAWVYMAGAAVYIASEIVSWATFKKASEREMKAYLKQSEKNKTKQKDALYSAAKQTEEAASAAEVRSTGTKITAAVFLAAAVVALVEFALAKFGTYSDLCVNPAANIDRNIPQKYQKFVNKFAPLNNAYAGDEGSMAAIGIIGGAALTGALIGWNTIMFGKKMSYTGLNRAILFGVTGMGALMVATSMIDPAVTKLKERAKQYNDLAKMLDDNTGTGIEDKKKTDPNAASEKGVEIAKTNMTGTNSITADELTSCSKGEGQKTMPDLDCECRKNNSCTKTDVKKEFGVVGNNLPSAFTQDLKNLTNDGGKITQGLGRGSLLGKQAAMMATRMSQRLSQSQTNLMQKLKSKNEPAIDFKKLDQEMNDRYLKAAKVVQEKLGESATKELAKMSFSPLNQSLSNEKEQEKQIQQLKEGKPFDFRQFAITQEFPSSSSNDEKGTPQVQNLTSDGELAKVNANYHDINKSSHVNIFEVISVRYKRSAWPKFFAKIKE